MIYEFEINFRKWEKEDLKDR